jgi:hypothetical protein
VAEENPATKKKDFEILAGSAHEDGTQEDEKYFSGQV